MLVVLGKRKTMMTNVTAIELFRPDTKRQAILYDFAMIIGGSAVLGLTAQAAVLLPFSPVPVTAQTLAVLLIGALFGARRGALTVLTYIAQGTAGLPVFAGATFGPAVLMGPTGGYLVGFVAAAYIAGRLAEQGWDRRFATTALAMVIANIAIYTCGIAWLTYLVSVGKLEIGLDKLLAIGCYHCLVGDALKILLAVTILPSGWKLLNRCGIAGRRG